MSRSLDDALTLLRLRLVAVRELVDVIAFSRDQLRVCHARKRLSSLVPQLAESSSDVFLLQSPEPHGEA